MKLQIKIFNLSGRCQMTCIPKAIKNIMMNIHEQFLLPCALQITLSNFCYCNFPRKMFISVESRIKNIFSSPLTSFCLFPHYYYYHNATVRCSWKNQHIYANCVLPQVPTTHGVFFTLLLFYSSFCNLHFNLHSLALSWEMKQEKQFHS